MSLQYDALHNGIVEALNSITKQGEAQQRYNESIVYEIGKLWEAIDNSRDDLHSVANRLEALTRATAHPFACDPDESGGMRDAD